MYKTFQTKNYCKNTSKLPKPSSIIHYQLSIVLFCSGRLPLYSAFSVLIETPSSANKVCEALCRVTTSYPKPQRRIPSFIISSIHHFINSSFHHFIISSFHHFIISSFHHFSISSFQHFSISAFHHFIISSFHHFITHNS